MEYPNSTFIVDHITEIGLGRVKQTVLVVGDSRDGVIKYLGEKLGLTKSNPVYIPNCKYPTIYDQTGKKPELTQVKILFNTRSWMK